MQIGSKRDPVPRRKHDRLHPYFDTVKGAIASANLYSLVETAKANDVEPFAYLSSDCRT